MLPVWCATCLVCYLDSHPEVCIAQIPDMCDGMMELCDGMMELCDGMMELCDGMME